MCVQIFGDCQAGQFANGRELLKPLFIPKKNIFQYLSLFADVVYVFYGAIQSLLWRLRSENQRKYDEIQQNYVQVNEF